MSYPNDRRYTNEHEWARAEGDQIVVGITQYAQESLGDIVFVELPEVGRTVSKGDSFGVVESTKAVSELYSPISGKVVAVNSPLVDSPDQVNADPHGAAWMVKLAPSDAAEFEALMSAAAYEQFLAESGH